MIKWCGYCCHYICECEPWADYRITHGVCRACYQRALADQDPDPVGLREIRTFFRSMQGIARSGSRVEVDQILQESRRLRMPPMDLLLGILQPLLVEIGQLWEAGQVSVAVEHRFTALAGRILAQIQKDDPGAAAPGPAVLMLFTAEGNEHHLGLVLAEYFFISCGIATHAVLQGPSAQTALDLLDARKPEAVGFSVAMAPQMRQVRKVAAEIRDLASPPRHFLVGGAALRMGLDLDPSSGIKPCRQPLDALPFLRGTGHGMRPS